MSYNKYNKNILDTEKYLKDLEKLKKEKIEFFFYFFNKEKIDLENKFNQLMISLEKKYNNYKYNIELFLKYYKFINALITSNNNIDNTYLNSLSLNLNIYKFKNFDILFSEFKNEEKLDCFVKKLNIYDNFIAKRKKLYEFIRNNRAFNTESYIFNKNKKYTYNFDNLIKFDILFDEKKENHAIFYKDNYFIYFNKNKLYFNNLIFERSKDSKDNSFYFFEKHFLEFGNNISKIKLMKNNKILVVCNHEGCSKNYVELFLILIDLSTERMIIEKSLKIEEMILEDFQELNISKKILLKARNEILKIIIFDINNFPNQKIYILKDICLNKYNNIFGYILNNIKTFYRENPDNPCLSVIIEIKKNILFIENATKRYIFSLKNRQYITIIDKSESRPNKDGLRKYVISNFEHIYFKEAILIFEQNLNNKLPWNRNSYFIDIKTFKKFENKVPISDGTLINLSENRFGIINNYNLTIYMKVGLKLQIYEFYTIQFIDNEIQLRFELSYNQLLTKKFVNILINNEYHPELKTKDIDYMEIDISSGCCKGLKYYYKNEYNYLTKFMKFDLKFFQVKSGLIYLLKKYPKIIIKISNY